MGEPRQEGMLVARRHVEGDGRLDRGSECEVRGEAGGEWQEREGGTVLARHM